MKIALVQPSFDAYRKSGILKYMTPPLGLMAILAGMPSRHTVALLDLYLPADRKKFANSRYDIVGISCQTMERDTVVALARKLKKRYAPVIVLGGIHPTIAPEDVLKEPCVDYAVRGAGDESFASLVDHIESGRRGAPEIDGVCCRRGGKLKIVKPAVIADLDKLPFPRYDAIDLETYLEQTGGEMTYETSRGCVHRCVYCSMWKMYDRIYTRSVERVVNDLRRLVRLSPNIKRIRFVDNTFNISRERMLGIARGMRRVSASAGRRICWGALMRPERIDDALARELERSGLSRVFLGIESANDHTLVRLRKGGTAAEMAKSAECFIRQGVDTRIAFQIGLPGETADDMWRTVRLALDLESKGGRTTISKFAPYPGTDIAADVKPSRGGSERFSIHPSDFKGLCFKHPSVTTRQIEAMIKSHRNGKKLYFLLNNKLNSRAIC